MFVNVVDQDPLDRLRSCHGGHAGEPSPQTRLMTGAVRSLVSEHAQDWESWVLMSISRPRYRTWHATLTLIPLRMQFFEHLRRCDAREHVTDVGQPERHSSILRPHTW
jgi:hypothetical protein